MKTNIEILNQRFHATMPLMWPFHLTDFSSDQRYYKYILEELGRLWVEIRSRMAPGARLRVLIHEEWLPPTENNYGAIASAVAGAANLIARHIWN